MGCTNACTALRVPSCDKLAHRCCGVHRIASGWARGATATQERMKATAIDEWGTHQIGHTT